MPEAIEVPVPLLNPNEREALVAEVYVSAGERVDAGDVLCTLETTKSTADVVAEQEGYVVGLRVMVGDVLVAGERMCWLAKEPDWQPPEPAPQEPSEEADVLEGLRITGPALTLAREVGLDLTSLPLGPLITRETIRRIQGGEEASDLPEGPFDQRALLIYGGGGHGKSLIDMVRALGEHELVGVLDDRLEIGSRVLEVPVLGGGEVMEALYARGLRLAVNAVGGVGDIMSRVWVFESMLGVGFDCPSLIHPTAFVEPSATLEAGVQVFPHAYVGSDVQIDFGVIINTGAVVSHDCHVGTYANVAPGALIAGGVSIGERVLIGMGVTINLRVSVGAGARVGNSAVVKEDVPPGGIVRAGAVWP